jgi:hypothetical protein
MAKTQPGAVAPQPGSNQAGTKTTDPKAAGNGGKKANK